MHLRREKTFFNKIPPRIYLVLGVTVLVLISVALGKEVVRRFEVNREISKLEKEVSDLEVRNSELADLIQYLNTDSFKEKEARTKLGLAKPGEDVVVVPALEKEQLSANNNRVTANSQEETSNPRKWRRYFFGK